MQVEGESEAMLARVMIGDLRLRIVSFLILVQIVVICNQLYRSICNTSAESTILRGLRRSRKFNHLRYTSKRLPLSHLPSPRLKPDSPVPNVCSQLSTGDQLQGLIVVPSRSNDFQRRIAIRSTWGNFSQQSSDKPRYKILFLVRIKYHRQHHKNGKFSHFNSDL